MGAGGVEPVLICCVGERDLLAVGRAVGEGTLGRHRGALGPGRARGPALLRLDAVAGLIAGGMGDS